MKILVGVILLLVLAAVALVLIFPWDTQYARGYSEKAFRTIRNGDTEASVLARLGPPLETRTCEPCLEWLYSTNKQARFSLYGEAGGTYTRFTFKSNLLETIHAQTEIRRGWNSSTLRVGPGEGYLPLTGADQERLKGANPEAVRARFGAPHQVYDFQASKILCYSRAASNGNYRLRQVGVGPNGRVVHVNRSIYWD